MLIGQFHVWFACLAYSMYVKNNYNRNSKTQWPLGNTTFWHAVLSCSLCVRIPQLNFWENVSDLASLCWRLALLPRIRAAKGDIYSSIYVAVAVKTSCLYLVHVHVRMSSCKTWEILELTSVLALHLFLVLLEASSGRE